MPTAREYTRALNETTGARFDLALHHIELAHRIISREKREELGQAASVQEKWNLIDRWFGEFLAPAVKNTIALIVQNNDWEAFNEMAGMAAVKSVSSPDASVISSKPLSEEAREWLVRRITQEHNARIVRFITDPGLMGGVKIRVGDIEVDNSLRTKLARFSSRV